MTKVKVAKLLKQIENKKKELAKKRDELRKLHYDLEDILDDYDQAEVRLDDGLCLIGEAINKMSELL